MTDSKRQLEQILGHEVLGVSSPYGACDDRVAYHAREAGYRLGLTTEPIFAGEAPNELLVGRTSVSAADSLPVFRLKACGAYQAVAYLSRAKRFLRQRPARVDLRRASVPLAKRHRAGRTTYKEAALSVHYPTCPLKLTRHGPATMQLSVWPCHAELTSTIGPGSRNRRISDTGKSSLRNVFVVDLIRITTRSFAPQGNTWLAASRPEALDMVITDAAKPSPSLA